MVRFCSATPGRSPPPRRYIITPPFTARLGDHQGLVDECLSDLTNRLAAVLPWFGAVVSIDSTVVRTHSNPNRKVVSDPEATWTAKNSARGKGGAKEWYFGYKYHALVCSTYGLPLVGFVTTANRTDSPELPALLAKAAETYEWFAPKDVIADKGYDSEANHRAALGFGAAPIIAIRRQPKGALYEGIYTIEGAPTCIGQVPMEYVRSDPQHGHLYRCPPDGCRLKGRRGVLYCHETEWLDRRDNPRLFGPVRRGSAEWKEKYRLRQAVERVFKGLKESRRLERHCIRGLKKIGLHVAMSVLSFQATAWMRLLIGQPENLRWMVRRVA